MEGLVIFIVIIIAFNLLNAILRAVRGGKAAQPVKSSSQAAGEPSGPVGFDSEIEDQPRMERSEYFPAARRKRLIDPFDFAAETENTAYRDSDTVPLEEEQIVEERVPRRVASPPITAADARIQAQSAGLRQLFTDRDALLNAFIFHEIIEKPVGMRRRR